MRCNCSHQFKINVSEKVYPVIILGAVRFIRNARRATTLTILIKTYTEKATMKYLSFTFVCELSAA